MDVLSILRHVKEFEDLPETALIWLRDHGEVKEYATDEYVFRDGDPLDSMVIILEGRLVWKAEQGNEFRMIGTFDQYSITGMLPYSRATKAYSYGQATLPTKVLLVEKSWFKEMIITQEELTTALVHKMSSRIRAVTRNELFTDKMLALGKLSAGLAHELNNPAAAVMRSAQELSKHLKHYPDCFKSITLARLEASQVDMLNDLLLRKLSAGVRHYPLMEWADREDELMDWLQNHRVEDADEMADSFVAFGFEPADMEAIAKLVTAQDLEAVLGWINQQLHTERMVSEIEEASGRIHHLVHAIKSYTHMDQAAVKEPADIHKGIESTLVMLQHKLKGITIEKDYQADLVHPKIIVSEMNQVWTNLIDNAADAMESVTPKKLTLTTRREGGSVCVTVRDNGPGIPEEIQGKIFDPFFTTKPVGKGTGLGMEVVYQIVTHQHGGTVTFETEPGRTEFKVCLPIT